MINLEWNLDIKRKSYACVTYLSKKTYYFSTILENPFSQRTFSIIPFQLATAAPAIDTHFLKSAQESYHVLYLLLGYVILSFFMSPYWKKKIKKDLLMGNFRPFHGSPNSEDKDGAGSLPSINTMMIGNFYFMSWRWRRSTNWLWKFRSFRAVSVVMQRQRATCWWKYMIGV